MVVAEDEWRADVRHVKRIAELRDVTVTAARPTEITRPLRRHMIPGIPATPYLDIPDDAARAAWLLSVVDENADRLALSAVPRPDDDDELDELEAQMIRAFDLASRSASTLPSSCCPPPTSARTVAPPPCS